MKPDYLRCLRADTNKCEDPCYLVYRDLEIGLIAHIVQKETKREVIKAEHIRTQSFN